MRVASQLIFCSPQKVLRRTIVEQNNYGVITRLFGLDENIAEAEGTLFFDGVLSAGIISLKEKANYKKDVLRDYQYIDLSGDTSTEIIRNHRPLIIDFGTSSIVEINQILRNETNNLLHLSLYEIIAACTYYPAVITGGTGMLDVNSQTEIILWEKTDLIKKKLTPTTFIRKISSNS